MVVDGGTVHRTSSLAARIGFDVNLGLLGTDVWLKQVDLERRYGRTRIDLRQALDRSAAEGLVTHRGYRAAEMEPRRSFEILELCALVETVATEQVLGRISPGGLERAAREDFESIDGLCHQNAAATVCIA
jgi:DNA-binding GntR family transcriptional regulator